MKGKGSVKMTLTEIRQAMPSGDSPEAQELGRRIRQIRRAQGLNARQVASGLSVRPGSYYRWEQGTTTPSAENLQKLCLHLGMSAEFLLGLPLPSEHAPLEIGALFEQIGQQFGETESVPQNWSEGAQQFLAALLQFGLEPIPQNLKAMLQRHPATPDSSAVAVSRWNQRKGLIDWFFTTSDAALDVIEDMVRRLDRK